MVQCEKSEAIAFSPALVTLADTGMLVAQFEVDLKFQVPCSLYPVPHASFSDFLSRPIKSYGHTVHGLVGMMDRFDHPALKLLVRRCSHPWEESKTTLHDIRELTGQVFMGDQTCRLMFYQS
jgi:hypothetical protein